MLEKIFNRKKASKQFTHESMHNQNTGITPSIITPITKEEHMAQMAARKEKVEQDKPVIAGLLHEVRMAKADSDLSMREWVKKVGSTDEGKKRLADLDWLQAKLLVEANPSDTSNIITTLEQQRDEVKKKATEIGEIASLCYKQRILADPSENNLPGEEAAKKAEGDWRQAKELVDDGDWQTIETIKQSVIQFQDRNGNET